MTPRPLTSDIASSRPEPPRPVIRVPRPAPGMRPARRRQSATSCIVLAVFEQDRPTPSLRRATVLARALNARLHVLRVLPGPSRLGALFSPRSRVSATRAVQRTLSARRATRTWLGDALDAENAVEHVAVVHGDFVEQAAAYAASIDAALIVVAPSEARTGQAVTSLACAASTPVLVAREPFGGQVIVAATDLRSTGYPVLQKAADLGRRVQASMVAVHNVGPAPVSGFDPVSMLGMPTPSANRHDGLEERMARLAQRLPIDTRVVVRGENDSADAVLDEARSHAADLVVVGTRPRSWCGGLLTSSVAARVVNHAERSVLVLPLDEVAQRASTLAPVASA